MLIHSRRDSCFGVSALSIELRRFLTSDGSLREFSALEGHFHVERTGCAFRSGDADEAIRFLESRADIDLVFTDVQMPGTMDGIKLSHYIRDRWQPVKLIVASGKATPEESSLPEGSRFFPKSCSDHAIADAMAGMHSNDSKLPNPG